MTWITRCPHCDTSFRVTYEQLGLAEGSVRCGACLAVFLATDNLEHALDEDDDDLDLVETLDDAEPEADDADLTEISVEIVDEGDDREAGDDENGDDQREGPGEAAATVLDDLDASEGLLEGYDGELDVETDTESLIGEVQPPRPGHRLAWALGSIALLLVLAVQLAWFNRTTLAENPQYRGYYETACGLIGCQLPVYKDIHALRVTHLVIRTHPSVAHALAVDAIIRNNAPWRQYFPDLRLAFSSIKGKPIANRIFKPAEYLGGEMSGVRLIPAKTEVHVSLEILDPGPDAMNYSLTIVPAG